MRRGAFDFYVQSNGKLFEPEQIFISRLQGRKVVPVRAEASLLDYAERSQLCGAESPENRGNAERTLVFRER